MPKVRTTSHLASYPYADLLMAEEDTSSSCVSTWTSCEVYGHKFYKTKDELGRVVYVCQDCHYEDKHTGEEKT